MVCLDFHSSIFLSNRILPIYPPVYLWNLLSSFISSIHPFILSIYPNTATTTNQLSSIPEPILCPVYKRAPMQNVRFQFCDCRAVGSWGCFGSKKQGLVERLRQCPGAFLTLSVNPLMEIPFCSFFLFSIGYLPTKNPLMNCSALTFHRGLSLMPGTPQWPLPLCASAHRREKAKTGFRL